MFCAFNSATTALVASSVGKNQLKKVQLSPLSSGILLKETSGIVASAFFNVV